MFRGACEADPLDAEALAAGRSTSAKDTSAAPPSTFTRTFYSPLPAKEASHVGLRPSRSIPICASDVRFCCAPPWHCRRRPEVRTRRLTRRNRYLKQNDQSATKSSDVTALRVVAPHGPMIYLDAVAEITWEMNVETPSSRPGRPFEKPSLAPGKKSWSL